MKSVPIVGHIPLRIVSCFHRGIFHAFTLFSGNLLVIIIDGRLNSLWSPMDDITAFWPFSCDYLPQR